MSRLWSAIQIFCVVAVAALIILFATMVFSGVLTPERVSEIVALLKPKPQAPPPAVEPEDSEGERQLKLQKGWSELREREEEVSRLVAIAKTMAEQAQGERIAAEEERRALAKEREEREASRRTELEVREYESLKELKGRLEKMEPAALSATLVGMWKVDEKKKAVVNLLIMFRSSMAAEVLDLMRRDIQQGGLGGEEYQNLVDRLRKANYRLDPQAGEGAGT
jgi:hypothetical protein